MFKYSLLSNMESPENDLFTNDPKMLEVINLRKTNHFIHKMFLFQTLLSLVFAVPFIPLLRKPTIMSTSERFSIPFMVFCILYLVSLFLLVRYRTKPRWNVALLVVECLVFMVTNLMIVLWLNNITMVLFQLCFFLTGSWIYFAVSRLFYNDAQPRAFNSVIVVISLVTGIPWVVGYYYVDRDYVGGIIGTISNFFLALLTSYRIYKDGQKNASLSYVQTLISTRLMSIERDDMFPTSRRHLFSWYSQ